MDFKMISIYIYVNYFYFLSVKTKIFINKIIFINNLNRDQQIFYTTLNT